ncbi:hypothetical protein, partial [Streptomyces scabiei]|uniref:hypothetical protein n=1 Tax=Streptomyces scabiei TaxID=1930 RepID=UPI0038F76536
SIRTTYTNFIVKIESLPVEKKTVHNGNQRQDFIQKPGQDQWIKLHYGNPIAVNGCRKKHEPVQQD